jgi:hypothetical protein
MSFRELNNSINPVKRTSVLLPFLFLSITALALFASCMSDPITEPTIVARSIFRPPSISHRDTNYISGQNVGDMIIRWLPSPSDTQQNFRGYVLRLYKAEYDVSLAQDTFVVPPIREVRLDGDQLSYTFIGIPLGHYGAAVWGRRNAASPDSLVLSTDSSGITFDFDPRPVFNPTNLRAVAIGRTNIRLHWDLPSTDTQIGMMGYQIYFTKTFKKDSTLSFFKSAVGGGHDTSSAARNEADISVPAGLDLVPEGEYKIWVKAVRKDSTQGTGDSSVIFWSGAEQLPLGGNAQDSLGVEIPTGQSIFIGQINSDFGIQAVSTNPTISVSISGTQVMLGGTKFVPQGDTASEIGRIFYSAPHADADYSVTSLTLPATVLSKGYIVYALFPNGTRARVFFITQPDGTLVTTSGSLRIRASFQPQTKYRYY